MYVTQNQLTTNLGSFEGTLGAQTAAEILAIQEAEQARAREAAKASQQKTAAGAATGSVIKGVGQILGAVGTIGAQFYAAHTQAKLAEKRMKYEQRQPSAPALDPALIAALSRPQGGGGSSTTIIIAVVVLLAFGVVGYLLMSGGDEGYGPEAGYGGAAAPQQYGPPPPQRQIKRVRRVRKKRKKRP